VSYDRILTNPMNEFYCWNILNGFTIGDRKSQRTYALLLSLQIKRR
jgi:hypothetical protein